MARFTTPAASTPGSVTTKTRSPLAASTTSPRRRTSPTPNSTRLRSVISKRRSARPVTTSPSAHDLDDLVDGRVAPDRHPASAAVRMEPALGRHADRVFEHPHLVEVALVGVGDRVGHLADFATERELLEWTAPTPGTVEPQHQRVPADPWSAIAWS